MDGLYQNLALATASFRNRPNPTVAKILTRFPNVGQVYVILLPLFNMGNFSANIY